MFAVHKNLYFCNTLTDLSIRSAHGLCPSEHEKCKNLQNLLTKLHGRLITFEVRNEWFSKLLDIFDKYSIAFCTNSDHLNTF